MEGQTISILEKLENLHRASCLSMDEITVRNLRQLVEQRKLAANNYLRNSHTQEAEKLHLELIEYINVQIKALLAIS